MDSAIGFPNTYRLDRDLSDGKLYPAFEQRGQQVMWPPNVTFSGHMISVSYFFYLLENEKIRIL